MEALGNLARWRLTLGQAGDVTEAAPLLAGVVTEAVGVDIAYNSDARNVSMQLKSD